MEAPKVIYTNGNGNILVLDFPVWDSDVKYIRADAPELVALVELAENIREYGGADIGDWEQAKAALAAWESLTNG